MSIDYHDPLRPHAHEPNPAPPSADPTFSLTLPDKVIIIRLADLLALPPTTLTECYIVSTGHGVSGPFSFAGPTLLSLIQYYMTATTSWQQVEVISADGFGTRIMAEELFTPSPAGPIILATYLDDRLMTRQQGIVRLIVPSETDDALRQVKWIGLIKVLETIDNYTDDKLCTTE